MGNEIIQIKFPTDPSKSQREYVHLKASQEGKKGRSRDRGVWQLEVLFPSRCLPVLEEVAKRPRNAFDVLVWLGPGHTGEPHWGMGPHSGSKTRNRPALTSPVAQPQIITFNQMGLKSFQNVGILGLRLFLTIIFDNFQHTPKG